MFSIAPSSILLIPLLLLAFSSFIEPFLITNTIEHNGSAKYQFVFDSLREPIEDDLEYIVAILQAVSASKTIDIDTIQKKLDIEYAEALDVIKFLEDYELIP